VKPNEKDIIPVTVIIPIKNQALALSNCLEPLKGMAAVVVVDSASTDGTVEVAQQWGAEVLQFKWNGRIPKKRNWALQNYQFTTDWVLFLDADEVLTPAFILEMREAIQSKGYVGYWLNYANFFQGRILRFGVPQRKLALFKVGCGFYERIEEDRWSTLDMEVHEHPILDGPLGKLKSRIRHEDYSNLSAFIERHNQYSTWEAQRYLAQRTNQTNGAQSLTFRQRVKYSLLESRWLSVIYFIYSYILLGGFLDGSAGLHYAIYKSRYFFDISQKIVEIRRRGAAGQPEILTEKSKEKAVC
jgi:glycosyltransferase involved in cell wall biosynthesis